MEISKNLAADFRPTRRRLLELGGLLGVALAMPLGALAAAAESLSASDLALIGDVAELIIPATDTGGAKQAGVPAFIDMMVAKWFVPEERDNFRTGMADFAKGAVAQYGKPFTALTEAQKTEYFGGLLSKAEGGSPLAAKDPTARSPFVVLMKRLTVFGYYTSELGGSVELSANLVPGEYLPHATLNPGDRADSDSEFSLSPFSAR